MKAVNIVLIVAVSVLLAICIFQQIEIFAIADEVSRLSDFVSRQIEINENLIETIEILVG